MTASRIKKIRLELNMTQAQLGQRVSQILTLGWNREKAGMAVHNFENKKLFLSKILKYLKVYNYIKVTNNCIN